MKSNATSSQAPKLPSSQAPKLPSSQAPKLPSSQAKFGMLKRGSAWWVLIGAVLPLGLPFTALRADPPPPAELRPLRQSTLLTFERPFFTDGVGNATFARLPLASGAPGPAASISKAQSHSGAQSLEIPAQSAGQGGIEIDAPIASGVSALSQVRFIDCWIKPAAFGGYGQFLRPLTEFTLRAGNVRLSFEQVRPGWGQFVWLRNVADAAPQWEFLPSNAFTTSAAAGTSGLFPLTVPPSPAPQSLNVSKDWIRITVRENLVTGTADIYVNSKLLAIGIDPGTAPGYLADPSVTSRVPILQIMPDVSNAIYVDDVQVTADNPMFPDTDRDGLPNAWEVKHQLSTVLSDRDLPPTDARFDTDDDGLEAALEFALGTNAHAPDTDGDGVPDGWEVRAKMNPLLPQDALYLDGAGLTNKQRYLAGVVPSEPTPAPRVPGQPITIHVRADASAAMNGTASRPFNTIAAAVNLAQDGDLILLDGNGGPFTGPGNTNLFIVKFAQFRGVNNAVIENMESQSFGLYFGTNAFGYYNLPQHFDPANPSGVQCWTDEYGTHYDCGPAYQPAIGGHSVANIAFKGSGGDVGLMFGSGCAFEVSDCTFTGQEMHGLRFYDALAGLYQQLVLGDAPTQYYPRARILGCRFHTSYIGMEMGSSCTIGCPNYYDAYNLSPLPRFSLHMERTLFQDNQQGFVGFTRGAEFVNCCWLNQTTSALSIVPMNWPEGGKPPLVLAHCTLRGNTIGLEYFQSCDQPGNICPFQPLILNSILWDNTNHFAPTWDWSYPTTLPVLRQTTISPPPMFDLVPPDYNSNQDPLFAGNTPYLDEGSPARDADLDPYLQAYLPVTNDLLGNLRDSLPDRGAFESFSGTDTDGDLLTDAQEQFYGLDYLNPDDAGADNDLDGFTNAQEILAGTLINNGGSAPVTDLVYVDPLVGNDAYGGGITTPVKTINRAIALASATPTTQPTKTIILRDGIYTGLGNRSWPISGTRTVRIRSVNGAGRTVFDFQGIDRAVTITSRKYVLQVEGVCFRNGGSSTTPDGGAVFINGADTGTLGESFVNNARFTKCDFIGCTAVNGGGAVCVLGPRGVILEQCRFLGNLATDGGALAIKTLNPARLGGFSAQQCTFSYNEAKTSGGGIFVGSGNHPVTGVTLGVVSVLELIDSELSYNIAGADGLINDSPDGGGLYIGNRYVSSASGIARCKFLGNSAFGSGGAVSANMGCPGFDECLFVSNIASGFAYLGATANVVPSTLNRRGGAVSLQGEWPVAMPHLNRCRIMGNYCEGKGGALSSNAGIARITNSAILNNHALLAGGALSCSSAAHLQLNHSTVVGNSAGATPSLVARGGGIKVEPGAWVLLDATILHGNKGLGNTVDNFSPSSALSDPGYNNLYGTFQYSNLEGIHSGTGSNCISVPPFFTNDGYHLHRNSPDRTGGSAQQWSPGDIDGEVATPGLTQPYCGCDLFVDEDGDNLADWVELQIANADPTDSIVSIYDVQPTDDSDGNGRTNAQDNNAGLFGGGGSTLPGNPVGGGGGDDDEPDEDEEEEAPDKDTDGDGLSDAEEALLGTYPNSKDSDGDGVWDGSDEHPLDEKLTFARIGTPHYIAVEVGEGIVIDVNNKGQVLYRTEEPDPKDGYPDNKKIRYFRWSPGDDTANPEEYELEAENSVPETGDNVKLIITTAYTVVGDDGTVGGTYSKTDVTNPHKPHTTSRAIKVKPFSSKPFNVLNKHEHVKLGNANGNPADEGDPDPPCFQFSGGRKPFTYGAALASLNYLDKNGVCYGSVRYPAGGCVEPGHLPQKPGKPSLSIALWPDETNETIMPDLDGFQFTPPPGPTGPTPVEDPVTEGKLLAMSPGGRVIYERFIKTYLTSREDKEDTNCEGEETMAICYSVTTKTEPEPQPEDKGMYFHQEGDGYNEHPGIGSDSAVFDTTDPNIHIVCVNDMGKEPKPNDGKGTAYNPGMMIGGSYDDDDENSPGRKACFWFLRNNEWERHYLIFEEQKLGGEVCQIQDNGAIWWRQSEGSKPRLWKNGALLSIQELIEDAETDENDAVLLTHVTTQEVVAGQKGAKIVLFLPFDMKVSPDRETVISADDAATSIQVDWESTSELVAGQEVKLSIKSGSSPGGNLDADPLVLAANDPGAEFVTLNTATSAGSHYQVEAEVDGIYLGDPDEDVEPSQKCTTSFKTATKSIIVGPGKASQITQTVETTSGPGDASAMWPDGKSTRTIRAHVYDAYGNHVAQGVSVKWNVAQGDGSFEPSESETDADGMAYSVLRSGRIGGQNIVVEMSADEISKTFNVAQTPYSNTTFSLTAGQLSLVGTKYNFQIAAAVNAADGAEIDWQTTRGTIAGATTVAGGVAMVTITVGAHDYGMPCVVTAAVGRSVALITKKLTLSDGDTNTNTLAFEVSAPGQPNSPVTLAFQSTNPPNGVEVFLAAPPAAAVAMPAAAITNGLALVRGRIIFPGNTSIFDMQMVAKNANGDVIPGSSCLFITDLGDPGSVPTSSLSAKALKISQISASLHAEAYYSNLPGGQPSPAAVAEMTREAIQDAHQLYDPRDPISNPEPADEDPAVEDFAPPALGGDLEHQAEKSITLTELASAINGVCDEAEQVSKQMDAIIPHNEPGGQVAKVSIGYAIWDFVKKYAPDAASDLETAWDTTEKIFYEALTKGKEIGVEGFVAFVKAGKSFEHWERVKLIADKLGVLPFIENLKELMDSLDEAGVRALITSISRFASSLAKDPSATALVTLARADTWLAEKLNIWAKKGATEQVLTAACGFFSKLLQDGILVGAAASSPITALKRALGQMVGTIVSAAMGSEDARNELMEMIPGYSWLTKGELVVSKWDAEDYYGAGKAAWDLSLQVITDVAFVIPVLKGAGILISKLGGALKVAMVEGLAGSTGNFIRRMPTKLDKLMTKLKTKTKSEVQGLHDELKQKCVGTGCFPAGTPVLMADGTLKSIESIQQGDWIMADNPLDQIPAGPAQVEALMPSSTSSLTHIRVASNAGGSAAIEFSATPNHPFWTLDRGWVEANGLEAGDRLLKPDGGDVAILGVSTKRRNCDTWNLTVAHDHAFFVSLQGCSVLVHNTNAGARSAMAYEVAIEVDDVIGDPNPKSKYKGQKVRPYIRAPRPITILSEADTLARLAQHGEIFYAGKASAHGSGFHEKALFTKKRYAGTGSKFSKWVNVPGTSMQVYVEVDYEKLKSSGDRKVNTTAVFRSSAAETTLVGTKKYANAELEAFAAESAIHDKRGAKSANPYKPTSDKNRKYPKFPVLQDNIKKNCGHRGLW